MEQNTNATANDTSHEVMNSKVDEVRELEMKLFMSKTEKRAEKDNHVMYNKNDHKSDSKSDDSSETKDSSGEDSKEEIDTDKSNLNAETFQEASPTLDEHGNKTEKLDQLLESLNDRTTGSVDETDSKNKMPRKQESFDTDTSSLHEEVLKIERDAENELFGNNSDLTKKDVALKGEFEDLVKRKSPRASTPSSNGRRSITPEFSKSELSTVALNPTSPTHKSEINVNKSMTNLLASPDLVSNRNADDEYSQCFVSILYFLRNGFLLF